MTSSNAFLYVSTWKALDGEPRYVLHPQGVPAIFQYIEEHLQQQLNAFHAANPVHDPRNMAYRAFAKKFCEASVKPDYAYSDQRTSGNDKLLLDTVDTIPNAVTADDLRFNDLLARARDGFGLHKPAFLEPRADEQALFAGRLLPKTGNQGQFTFSPYGRGMMRALQAPVTFDVAPPLALVPPAEEPELSSSHLCSARPQNNLHLPTPRDIKALTI